jgi:hypothetical protein
MRRQVVFLGVLILGALGGAPRGDAQKLVGERVFWNLDAPLAPTARAVTGPLVLEDGTEVRLELSPLVVFAPGAQIVVHGKDGDRLVAPPADRWFSGRVAGDPSSVAVLARGRSFRGFVMTRGQVSIIGPESGAYGDEPPGRTLVRTLDLERETPDAMRLFACATEWLQTPSERLPLESLATTGQPQPLSGVMYYASVAVETDYELYKKFNSVTNLSTYVGDLFAAISAIYQRDVLVTLQVNYLSVWTTSSDPWSAADTVSGLYEFGDYWHANHAGLSRVTAHFLSGKNLGGGVSWLGVLCRADFYQGGHWGGGYGFTASLSGSAPQNLTTTYWDFMAVAHEIGHNFSSPHTHCYVPPVDKCYSGESNCYSGPTSVPPEKGTIMSYCHLLSGGYSNIKMFLGVNGEPSQAVLTQIRGYVEGKASCLGTVAGPVVTGVSPSSGTVAGGTPVTISGTGFPAQVVVKFGGVGATSVVVVNANTITAVTPAHAAGVVDVRVLNTQNNYQEFLLAGGFTYTTAPPPPTVIAINPNTGPTAGGTIVTITGTGFASGATVTLGGVAATSVVVVNSTTITATTGPHATGTVNVVVVNPDTQSSTLTGAYFYVPPPAGVKFYPLSPCRVADTRWPNGLLGGPALQPNGARLFTVTSACGIPASAVAISVNVTVVAGAGGFFTLYPGNGVNPATSNLNFSTGQVRANDAILYLSTDGSGSINVLNGSVGSNHFILDVNGYFR